MKKKTDLLKGRLRKVNSAIFDLYTGRKEYRNPRLIEAGLLTLHRKLANHIAYPSQENVSLH